MTSSLSSLSLRDADLPLLREALEDAIAERRPSPWCGRCAPDGTICPEHLWDAKRAERYRELLERIGDET